MLFDLQSRGRRSVVKIIYTGLAVLMGAGFILFGVGTGFGGSGLFDLFNGNGTSTKAQVSAAEKHANREVRLHPKDPKAWADLTRARYQGADYDTTQNAFTEVGREHLLGAVKAWQTYLTLEPKHPDPTLARLMATAYSQAGLNDPANAADALEIVTQAEPSAASYAQLAQYSYLALEFRKGNLAADKAVALAPKAQRKLMKTQLNTVRRKALQQQLQNAAQNGAATTGGG